MPNVDSTVSLQFLTASFLALIAVRTNRFSVEIDTHSFPGSGLAYRSYMVS